MYIVSSKMAFIAFTSVARTTALASAGSGTRRLSSAAEGGGGEFSGKNAYQVLGVAEGSSFAEIKASFRRLAKETHPDVSASSDGPAASHQFLEILAAYEILSDSEKRAHYDGYLFSLRKILQKKPAFGSVMHMYTSSVKIRKQSEVVEWLKFYRLVIDDILMERKVAEGSGYLNELESELYSAIRAAYYGPVINSMDLLPECFEAEARSTDETSEVLHLVSGRYLFGIICLVDKVPKLSDSYCKKLSSLNPTTSGISEHVRQTVETYSSSSESLDNRETQVRQRTDFVSDVYKSLELHIYGRIVATATRSHSKCKINGIETVGSEDHIHVFLSLNEDKPYVTESLHPDSGSPDSSGSPILLGTITGLGTNAEGVCSVYDRSGTKTHVVMKHKTLMVKHMHWYQVGDKISVCECRCTRARLPPSRFWLFEPRCSMHDIGGWYIETFGRDKKGKTIPSQRQWDNMTEHHEKRLHPAMYLVALAYRTLDLEVAQKRKQIVKDIMAPKVYSMLHWCKKRF